MRALSENTIYFDGFDNIIDKCNNIYQNTIKMKPIDVDSDAKDPEFKIRDHVKI